jgi:hypothetical protein
MPALFQSKATLDSNLDDKGRQDVREKLSRLKGVLNTQFNTNSTREIVVTHLGGVEPEIKKVPGVKAVEIFYSDL